MALNGEWDVTSGKKGSGRNLKYNRDDVAQAVREIPLRQRSTGLSVNTGGLDC